MDMGRSVDRMHPSEPCLQGAASQQRNRRKVCIALLQRDGAKLLLARIQADDKSSVVEYEQGVVLPIPVPPPKEQRRIVEILETTFDAAQEIEDAIVAAQRDSMRTRQAVLATACSGRL